MDATELIKIANNYIIDAGQLFPDNNPIKQTGIRAVLSRIPTIKGEFNRSFATSPSLEIEKFIQHLNIKGNQDLFFRLSCRLLNLNPDLEYTPEQVIGIFLAAEMVKVGMWLDRDISRKIWSIQVSRTIDCSRFAGDNIKGRIANYLEKLPNDTLVVLGNPFYETERTIYDTGITDDILYLVSPKAINYYFYQWEDLPDHFSTNDNQFLWRLIIEKWDMALTCETKVRLDIVNPDNIIKFINLPVK